MERVLYMEFEDSGQFVKFYEGSDRQDPFRGKFYVFLTAS